MGRRSKWTSLTRLNCLFGFYDERYPISLTDCPQHPSHTSEQWQSFFDNAILKNYEKPKVANGSITILQSIIDRPGVTPTDTATPDTARIPPSSGNDAAVQSHIHSSANDPRPVESPSFQPESPTLQSYSINSQCKADDSPTGTGKDDSQTRARLSEILSPSEGALKRKKDQIELREDVDENTQNKRVRRKSSPEQDRENPVGSKEALSGSDAVALSEGVGAAEPAPLRDRGSEDSDSTELPELQSLFNAQEHKSTLGVKSVAQAAPVDDGSVEESYTGDSPHDEEQAPSNEKGTQAILAEDTQIPDLGLADPDGGWDSLIASPLAELHSSPRSAQVDPAEEKAELDEWIDARIEAGFSEGDILLSLKCSSMDTQLAQIALHSLAQGRGIPVNVRGIWTPEEDELLDGGNSRKIRALEEKHGTEAFNARWDFMGHYRSDL
ncbi:MAG: hypothetical protein M1819_001747 [Sarea resinae]|nr:MAG: hypothetical protein M1819_001747 [Sarea resinae]